MQSSKFLWEYLILVPNRNCNQNSLCSNLAGLSLDITSLKLTLEELLGAVQGLQYLSAAKVYAWRMFAYGVKGIHPHLWIGGGQKWHCNRLVQAPHHQYDPVQSGPVQENHPKKLVMFKINFLTIFFEQSMSKLTPKTNS